MTTRTQDLRRIQEAEGLTVVGRSGGSIRSFTWSLREIVSRRELIARLVAKEVRTRYKGSYLGILWSLLRPMVQLAVYYLFIGNVLGAARNIPDFAIFVFGNLIIWGLFTETVSSGTSSILANAGLVKKIYLPREIFPITSLGAALFNFGIQLVILLVGSLVAGAFPLHIQILYLVPAVLIMSVYGLAFGLALGAVNVYLRDTQHLVEIALLLMFWASPILYSLTFVTARLHGGLLEQIYLANPATVGILSMQKATWTAGAANASQLWPADLDLRIVLTLAIGLILLSVAQRIFSRLQGNFAQEM